MADNLEELYEKYNILSDAKDKISQHSEEYLECMKGAKGNEKEKKLAAQIISKFFKHFPSLQGQALEAMLDLCEDDNSSIRMSAMKLLPLLCKDSKENLHKIADALAQLLELEDQEYLVACNCLLQVFKEDPIIATKAICSQIHKAPNYIAREKCVLFTFKKLTKAQEKLNAELEDLLVQEGKRVLQDSSGKEFEVVIAFLISSKLTKTVKGQQELVDLVAERAEIDQNFDPLEDDHSVDRILTCLDQILPLFSASIESTRFVIFYCDQLLPQWNEIGNIEKGDDLQLHILRQLAELCLHCGKLENASRHVNQIFEKMMHYMPLPPLDTDLVKMPNLDFTSVECLLFAFHRLARQCPDFLTADPQVLKDFRTRLTYFARGVQGCKKSVEGNVNKDKQDADKLKLAPVVLSNINSLIKDLFYQPPMYKCNITLSFKSFNEKAKAASDRNTQKRHVPITFDGSNSSTKQVRANRGGDNVKLYTPPSGKFSNKFQNFDRVGIRGRGRGALRGSRGWGGGRGNWRN